MKVKPGDSVSSIAARCGFFWETIWYASENTALRRKREDPNVLLPGDELHVPERERKEAPAATERRHTYKRKGVPEHLVLQLKFEGKPLADREYVLDVDGHTFKGKTDKDGQIDCPIPPHAETGTLTVETDSGGLVYNLRLGHLDPVSEPTGLHERLRNLGYDAGEDSTELTEQTALALCAFQRDNDLEETGKPDTKTQEQLRSMYRS